MESRDTELRSGARKRGISGQEDRQRSGQRQLDRARHGQALAVEQVQRLRRQGQGQPAAHSEIGAAVGPEHPVVLLAPAFEVEIGRVAKPLLPAQLALQALAGMAQQGGVSGNGLDPIMAAASGSGASPRTGVDALTTSGRLMPRQRNFESVVT